MLSFALLGPVTLYRDGRLLQQFRSRKEAALLIYLAHTARTLQRDHVADLLWEDRTAQQARSNLRTLLTRLRKQVGDDMITTRTTVALASGTEQRTDSVVLLQTLATVGQLDSVEKVAVLQTALNTYRGEFLSNFYLDDAPAYNMWAASTREQIRRQVVAACSQLGHDALSQGDVKNGIDLVRRWLEIDALDEAAHMLLIRLLLEDGRQAAALAHYEHCVHLLRTELDVEPPAEMTALINRARPALPPSRQRMAAPRPATRRHNLPAAHDQFFGRAAVQQQIHASLDQPWCRLVTIAGAGGVGKTRLAITVARACLPVSGWRLAD